MRPPGLTVDSNWLLTRGVPGGVVPVRGTVPVLALHLHTKSFRIIGLRLPYAPPLLLLGSCLGTWLAGHLSSLCACLRDDNDFADPDLSCLEHTLDSTGNGAVKAITLHTFVDVSLSYSYPHLTHHPSQARKRAESFVLARARISWT